MTRKTAGGFTLIEVIMVIGLVGVIALFGVAMSMSSVAKSGVIQERDRFVSLILSGARAEALANVGEQAHGIHIDDVNHRYILFEGTSYNASDPSNRETPYSNESIDISNTGGDDIVFEQLSGNVSHGAGTVTFKIVNSNTEVKISINEVGQINW